MDKIAPNKIQGNYISCKTKDGREFGLLLIDVMPTLAMLKATFTAESANYKDLMSASAKAYKEMWDDPTSVLDMSVYLQWITFKDKIFEIERDVEYDNDATAWATGELSVI